jgi:hypothetical protein
MCKRHAYLSNYHDDFSKRHVKLSKYRDDMCKWHENLSKYHDDMCIVWQLNMLTELKRIMSAICRKVISGILVLLFPVYRHCFWLFVDDISKLPNILSFSLLASLISCLQSSDFTHIPFRHHELWRYISHAAITAVYHWLAQITHEISVRDSSITTFLRISLM